MIELIPETHLFRKINRMVLFDFICDFTASYYSTNGRPYVDLVSMFEMLLNLRQRGRPHWGERLNGFTVFVYDRVNRLQAPAVRLSQATLRARTKI